MVPSDYIQQYLAESRQILQEQDKAYTECLEEYKLKVGIIIYSIVHILTIVFSGSRNVKCLPIFHCSFNGLVISHSSRHAQSFHISNTDFFIQISKMSIVSISSI